MSEQIQTALSEITAQFADKRTQLCQLEITAVTDGRISLQGTVLDGNTLTAVISHLIAHFPEYAVDTLAVTILRQSNTPLLAVYTTITGLHNAPGFLSEPGSQLLNGQIVEPLGNPLREDGRWLFVRQDDGYLGWMYRPYLGDVPARETTHLICEPVALLRAAPEENAPLLSRVLAGTAVAATAVANSDSWQQIELAGGLMGWLPSAHCRHLDSLPQTPDARRAQLVADAHQFIGVPYLWAGVSGYGIDCSGYVQLLHKLSGITLPRDADMQLAAGQPVSPPYQPGDLLFFGSDGDHRRISHVGMSLGGWQMIHSSRSKNGVFVDDVQAVDHLRNTFAGAASYSL